MHINAVCVDTLLHVTSRQVIITTTEWNGMKRNNTVPNEVELAHDIYVLSFDSSSL